MNDFITVGRYDIASSSITNLPKENAWGLLEVSKSGYAINQTYYIDGTTDEIYYRKKNISQNTWSSWQRIDNYGTSSLSELASALGEIKALGDQTDFNLINTVGAYMLDNSTMLHSPGVAGTKEVGILIVISSNERKISGASLGIQLYARYYNGSTVDTNIYIRSKWSASVSDWNQWKTI